MKKAIRNLVIVFVVTAIGALTGCGSGGNTNPIGGGSVASVSVSANPTSVQVGKTSQLTVNVSCSGTCDQSYTLSADYGTISGTVYTAPSSVPSGSTATITASASGKTGTATITITAAPAVSVSAVSGTTIPQVGVKYTYAATVTNPIGSNVSMTWYSSNSSVVSIDPATGIATPLQTGTATITATASADTSKTSSVTIKVRDWVLATSGNYDVYLVDVKGVENPVQLLSSNTCVIRSFSFDRLSFACTIGSKILIYTTDGTASGTVLKHTVETGLYSVIDAGFSPDGKHLIYQATATQPDNSSKAEIYSSTLDGTGQQLLESETVIGLIGDGPRYSPDGTKILWHHIEGGAEYVWIMNADGTNQEQLINTPSGGGVWSADGDKIFYHHVTVGGIYWINADGTGGENLLIGGPVFHPTPSADEVRLAYWDNNTNTLKVADTTTGATLSTLNFATGTPLMAW
jgi:hypothetical protein